MEVSGLYQFVLLLVLVGMVLGVGIVVLDNFSTTSGIGSTASTAINDTVSGITPIASTWLPLIVTVAALAIIMALVIRSFGTSR